MEPETHRLDREALLAERRHAAERVRRETDAVVAAAEEKRRAFLERFITDLRADAEARLERERIAAELLARGTSRPGDVARGQEPAPADRPRAAADEPYELVRAAAG